MNSSRGGGGAAKVDYSVLGGLFRFGAVALLVLADGRGVGDVHFGLAANLVSRVHSLTEIDLLYFISCLFVPYTRF